MLKINSVGNVAALGVFKVNSKKNSTNPIQNDIQNEAQKEQFNSGIPRAYINFRGKTEDISSELHFSDDATALLDRAKNIAKEMGHEEITPFHIVAASIEETKSNYNQIPKELLDAGAVDSISSLNKLGNVYMKNNILNSADDFKFFAEEVNLLQEQNEIYLKNLPVNEELKGKERDIPLSEELKSMLDETQKQTQTIDSYMVLGTAFNVNTKNKITYTAEFLKDLQSTTYYKKQAEVDANYMKFYDTKAVDAWNKLALGSNLFITYGDEKEANRIETSLINTLDAKKHGNFNSANTLMYAISDNVKPAELLEEVLSIQDTQPEVNKIFMVNLDSLIANNIDKSGELSYPLEVMQMVKSAKDNVKFVFFQNHDTYYQYMKEPSVQKGYSNFISYSIPPMHAFEAQEVIANDKKMLKDIKTPFTKDARNKAISSADKMEGIYPDKAINLMQRIATYYGDSKKRIYPKDVDEFVNIAGDLFKEDDKSAIVYDTGKNLQSLYGKDTVKKDLEAIVRQIKSGNIGTRGYIMYSQDDEAGSGRRFTAQALAGEAKVPYMEIASSDFAKSVEDEDGFRTSSASEMNRIFTEVKKAAKQNENKTAILFVNNFEDFAFSGPYLAGYKQAMAQMEKEMAKAESEHLNIVVIGSTNQYYTEAIPMVVRGFNQTIALDSPAFNKKSRKDIITNRIKETGIPLAGRTAKDREEIINKLVKLTGYMSFVEIKTVVDNAKQIMLERNKKKASIGEFIEAYLQIQTGRTSHPEMPEYNKRATTSHECGHATNLEVMGEILKDKGQPWHQSDEVNFITLDPRGNFLGAVFEGSKDNGDYPFEALFTGLVCCYGGYSCEKKFFDMDGSAGIGQDLAQATRATKKGVEYYGLGHHTGQISNAARISSGKYSENVYKDMEVILSNAKLASELITDTYAGFNKWFTDKYSKLIGSDNCMVDGDDFRLALSKWKAAQPKNMQEEFEILGDMVMDIIKASKNGKFYGKVREVKKAIK